MLRRRPALASSAIGPNSLGRRFLRKQRNIVGKPKISTPSLEVDKNSAVPAKASQINQHGRFSIKNTILWSPSANIQRTKGDIEEAEMKSDFAFKTSWLNEVAKSKQGVDLIPLPKSPPSPTKSGSEMVLVGKIEKKAGFAFKTSWLNELVQSNEDIGPIPLLKSPPTATKSSNESVPELGRQFEIKRLANMKDTPAAWFQANIDQGTADLKKAFICLNMAYKESMEAFSDAEGMRRLGSLGAGSTVLSWLQSGHSIMPPEAFERTRLTHMLVHALVAEFKEAVLWQWWWETRPPANVGDKVFFAWKMELMRAFMYAGLKAAGLDKGLMIIFKALRTKRGFGKLLFPCASDLVDNILELPSVELTDITLYDDFMTAKDKWSTEPELNGAILAFLHPTHPDCDPAMKLLANTNPQSLARSSLAVRIRYQMMCWRLSGVLAARGSTMDADRVLAFKEQHLGDVPKRAIRAHAGPVPVVRLALGKISRRHHNG